MSEAKNVSSETRLDYKEQGPCYAIDSVKLSKAYKNICRSCYQTTFADTRRDYLWKTKNRKAKKEACYASWDFSRLPAA